MPELKSLQIVLITAPRASLARAIFEVISLSGVEALRLRHIALVLLSSLLFALVQILFVLQVLLSEHLFLQFSHCTHR